MEKRTLGKTGEKLSVVGFGGIVVADESPGDAEKFVKEAIDRGVNYFDVAPTYGNAEERLGPALEPYRDSVFLACKTAKRRREDAARQLGESLARLRTDHFDLYQFHGVAAPGEAEEITSAGGALEAFREARDSGVIRHIGFTAHSEEAAVVLMERFDFDSVMFPVNYVTWNEGGFGRRLFEEAQGRGVGILAIKALARRPWEAGETRRWPKCWYAPVESRAEAETAVRFTLSKPVTAALSPSHAELLWWMCDAAENFRPLTPREQKDTAAKARGIEPLFRATE